MSPVSWGDIFTLSLRGDRIMELRHSAIREWKSGQRVGRMIGRKRSRFRDWGNMNRILKGICVAAICGVMAGVLLAQASSKSGPNAAAVAHGKSLFQQKCAVCHNDTSEQQKIGPGLKSLLKRGMFSVNGNKITDDSLKTWIENGDQLMPPFKGLLEPPQIQDVIAYVKTL
jgi:mono/diheme cytochrome c family protein